MNFFDILATLERKGTIPEHGFVGRGVARVLAADGYVTRGRGLGGRPISLTITDKGRAALAAERARQAPPRVTEVRNEAPKPKPPSMKKALLAALERLTEEQAARVYEALDQVGEQLDDAANDDDAPPPPSVREMMDAVALLVAAGNAARAALADTRDEPEQSARRAELEREMSAALDDCLAIDEGDPDLPGRRRELMRALDRLEQFDDEPDSERTRRADHELDASKDPEG